MLYREVRPKAPLDQFVRMLWYTRDPNAACGRQRVLPNGCLQIVINLAADSLTDCAPDGTFLRHNAPALIVGLAPTAEVIDTSDLAELIGIVFEPGRSTPFLQCPADLFHATQTPLVDLWGRPGQTLRERLQETATVSAKFFVLEQFLLQHASQQLASNPAVDFALTHFVRCKGVSSIARVTERIGLSERRFAQLFREHVGASPKLFCRIQRFRHALGIINTGGTPRWADLAAECGYYDQAHFANDFRGFAGLSPTEYLDARISWDSHVKL